MVLVKQPAPGDSVAVWWQEIRTRTHTRGDIHSKNKTEVDHKSPCGNASACEPDAGKITQTIRQISI